MRRLMTALSVATAVLIGGASAASGAPFPEVIVLQGASSAEGIAVGAGSTFYAGDLMRGDIYRGDLRAGTATLFRDVPSGRAATGMKVDLANKLLFVSGAFTGQGYVYDLETGDDVAVFQLGNPAVGTFINDVALTKNAAYFTDSRQPVLYRVPIGNDGSVDTPTTLALSGPAANLTGSFNINGIAATPDGKTLIVAHSADQTLYTVDPATGSSAAISVVSLPNVDGILYEAGRLWAVQNQLNRVTELNLSPDLSSATVEQVITSPNFNVPTTVARFGDRLALVNAKFGQAATQYEAVIVSR